MRALLLGLIFIGIGCGSVRPDRALARFDEYEGEYALDARVAMVLRVEGRRLMAKVTGQDYFEVFPNGDDRFHFDVVEARLVFIRGADRKVIGFTLLQNEKEHLFLRTSNRAPEDFSRRVEAGGYRVRMMQRGAGTATVVFESGLGESMDAWEIVAAEVAGFAKVVTYDRSGLGLSERTGRRRTAKNVATDLRRALRNAGVSEPLVLVGNSAGGLYGRVFANLFPERVAGMVLVEPSSEEYEDWLRATHPEAYDGEEAEVKAGPPGFRDHAAAWRESLEQARGAWPLPRVPVIVLTGTRAEKGAETKRARWLEMHRRFIQHAPMGEHVEVAEAGHGLLASHPEAVVAAIRKVVLAARASGLK